MFTRNSLGELDDDMYRQTIYGQEIKYTNDMQSQDITDYEKEIQLGIGNQFSMGLADINLDVYGTGIMSQPQLLGLDLLSQTSLGYAEGAESETKALSAGFDFSSNWPILGVLAIGVLMMFKKEPKKMKAMHMKRKRR
jgi:hypothetical protein